MKDKNNLTRQQLEFIKRLQNAGFKNIKVGNTKKQLIDKELLIVK